MLAHRLLMSRSWVVVHDGKGTLAWDGYTVVRRLRDLVRLDPHRAPRLIYRPDPVEAQDPVVANAFFRWIYERRNTTLYVDETYAVVFRGGVLPYHQACITRGRERGVEVWSATQRPSWIPLMVLSEAEHWYVFRLNVREDRKRLEGILGVPEVAMHPRRLPKTFFYYSKVGDEVIGPLRLRLEGD